MRLKKSRIRLINLTTRNNNKGIAVILVVGALSVLIIVVAALAINMRFELLIAKDSLNSTKAIYLAEAGISEAIIGIRETVKEKFTAELGDDWASVDSSDIRFSDSTLLDSTGEYKVYVYDTQRMVNLNNANSDLLSSLLEIVLGVEEEESESIAGSIIDARPFQTKREIIRLDNIDIDNYSALRDYITVDSWNNPSTGRSPVNINTAPKEVLHAVLAGLFGSDNKADSLADEIIEKREDNSFYGWSDFDDFIDAVTTSPDDLTDIDRENIKNNCNPNRNKPTNFTTEFSFHAGGYFEIHSTGNLYKTDSQGEILAQRIIVAIIRLSDVWNKVTKDDFTAGDIYFEGSDETGEGVPEYERVNWLDSCPVNSDDSRLLYESDSYNTISNSIKLGFWDNFNEENNDEEERGWSWSHWQETLYGDIKIEDYTLTTNSEFSAFELMGVDSGQWNAGQRFMVRAHFANRLGQNDIDDTRWKSWEDTGALEFHGPGEVHKLFLSEFRVIWWDGQVSIDGIEGIQEVADFMDVMLRANWYGGGGDHYMFINELYGLDLMLGANDPDSEDKYKDEDDNWVDEVRFPNDGNRINPDSATYKLVVDDRETPNYTPYLAVSRGTAHYCLCPDDDGETATYNPINTNFHSLPDLGHNDRYGFMWHGGGNNFLKDDWRLKLYTNSRIAKWKEVRIIYPEGYYLSPVFNLDSEVQLGAISWTETIPESADAASETVTLEIDTGNSLFEPLSNGAVLGESGNLSGSSNSLQFKVTLKSDNESHQETPAFEDITVTYLLPRTQILYWSRR
jgi:type II secretory pathway component PulK